MDAGPLSADPKRVPVGPLFTAGSLLGLLWSAYWERRTRLATMSILSSLDDCTLKDLGLHRSEIGSLVYGTRRERRF
jgi:uncharacterized protein YjiS (DUF1127 family)